MASSASFEARSKGATAKIMKSLLENFNKSLLTETSLGDYINDGKISLYHYAPSRLNAESLTIDPKYFADRATRNSYTRNEYAISTVPRTFYYADPRQRELHVAQGSSLYQAHIPADRIYDLRSDPDGYIKKVRHPVYGLRKGEEWNDLLEAIRNDYDGIFYGGRFDVISLFIPYDAVRLSDEKRQEVE